VMSLTAQSRRVGRDNTRLGFALSPFRTGMIFGMSAANMLADSYPQASRRKSKASDFRHRAGRLRFMRPRIGCVTAVESGPWALRT